MRIAIISTPFIRMPPVGYGGTELFCYELSEGLNRLGHEVTVFSTADSEVGCELRSLFDAGQWPPEAVTELSHVAWAFREVAKSRHFDVVHSNSGVGVPFAQFVTHPVVHTIHHARDEHASRLYQMHPDVTYVAISHRQLALEVPLRDGRVIHHGVDPRRYPSSVHDDGYLAHIGRFCFEKGTHIALEIAQLARMRILLGGRVHPQDQVYFEEYVAPRLERSACVHVGELDGEHKRMMLQGARALVCPLQWEEPFGLIAIEAMLCGTPVLGFARGSFPEIVDQGVTGFLCDGNIEELARRARGLESFDRAACARRARERFSKETMVARYDALYRELSAQQHHA